ncbi:MULTISPECIES: helix-turn-helix transcriptional regulator [Rhodococcus]|uniref:helix-turn-helix transcriptional regulator n=1 Tax=Rhodococcus TaxID=1827 RepID=UPI0024B67948|nr:MULTISPECIES: helix-turn-helix transcriptional regulator [Rhodococcus]MDI9941804.1 helix-turn-helix transcriptional regulator [Rhodococcus sp. IEGM 1302]MEA1798334.1 helix-turn-helix transcriptional regulator [Rhodococcus qingshengii]
MAATETAEQRFGERVKWERERRKWSQAELARRVADAGVPMHPTTVTKIEARDALRPRSIRLDEADAFARVFDRSIDQLLGVARKTDSRALAEEVAATAAVTNRRMRSDLGAIFQLSERVQLEVQAIQQRPIGDADEMPVDDVRMVVALSRIGSVLRSGTEALKSLSILEDLFKVSESELLEEFLSLPDGSNGSPEA